MIGKDRSESARLVLSPKPNDQTEESWQARLGLTGLGKRRYGIESFLASLLSVSLSVGESNQLSPKKGLLRLMKSTFTASKEKGGQNSLLVCLFLGMSLIQLVNPC